GNSDHGRSPAVDHPDDDILVVDEILEQRRTVWKSLLDLGHGHGLDGHQRRLFAALRADALEKRAVLAIDGLDDRARPLRFLDVVGFAEERSRFGPASPQPHFLLDEPAGAALGERGLAAE